MAEEADPRSMPTWVTAWNDPTKNYGRNGGTLRTPRYKRDIAIAELEVHLMLSDLEFHANWGVGDGKGR